MKKWQTTSLCVILVLGISVTSGCIKPIPSTEELVVMPTSQNAEVIATPLPITTALPGTAGTVEKTLPTTIVQKTLLFSDDLSLYRSEWDTGYTDKRKNLSSYYSGGSLHMRPGLIVKNSSATNHKLFKNFNDFILDVDTRHVGGGTENWQGAEVRVKDDKNHYFLAISSNGSFIVSKTENNVETFLNEATYSGYINQGTGGTNHIRIEADKNALRLFANGHHLTTVYDDTFIAGMLNLRTVFMNPNPGTEVAFSNLTITTT